MKCLMSFFSTGSCKSWSSSQERVPINWRVHVGYDRSHRRQHWYWSDCCWSLFVVKCFVRKLAQTYPPVTIRVYPYLCSRVRVYVGSAVPYPDPYPPNPYPCTRKISQTLAQHYSPLLPTFHLVEFLETYGVSKRYRWGQTNKPNFFDLTCDSQNLLSLWKAFCTVLPHKPLVPMMPSLWLYLFYAHHLPEVMIITLNRKTFLMTTAQLRNILRHKGWKSDWCLWWRRMLKSTCAQKKGKTDNNFHKCLSRIANCAWAATPLYLWSNAK